MIRHRISTARQKAIRTALPVGLLVVFVFGLHANLHADDLPAIRDAQTDAVWLDADEGEILPVTVSDSSIESSNRNSRWLPKADRVKAPAKPKAAAGGGTGTGLFSMGNAFAWALLVLLLIAAVSALIFGVSKLENGGGMRAPTRPRHDDDEIDEITIERMKHLPKELRRTDVNLRSEAERLMHEGLYDQAIILLFGHQLLMLDREHFLRLSRGKTNRRYLRECRSKDSSAADKLHQTVEAFESSYFGRHEITPSRFEHLWNNNLSLETLIDQHNEVAA